MSQPSAPRPGSVGLATHWPVPDVAVLSVAGDLDMLTSPELAQALEEVLGREPRTVVVDLSEVSFLGSAGLAVLVTAHERAEPRDMLRIVAPTRATRRIFTMTGLDELLALYPSRDAALAGERAEAP
jgi:anti-sigma B factor antagonist